MAALTFPPRSIRPALAILRLEIVALTLATAWIHASLGSTLFLLNAVGYVVLAAALVVPGPVARLRWLVRYALIGFAATTIIAWFAFGARFDLAYLSKAIELALIGLLLVESWVVDGGPLVVARRVERMAASAIH
ncbi:MAG TPA: hypothetical protein VFN41_14745 [Candidatus Limnocylindrales bacterium]|nr:hypothetical protein [Candidatus Limnocylindrales bacterium]